MTDNHTIPAEVDRDDVRELETQSTSLAETYWDYVVTNYMDYRDGAEDLKLIKGQIKALTDKRMEITRPMDAAKKAVMDFFATPLKRLQEAEGNIKRGLLEYKREQDRKAAEERRKAEERQRKEEEKLREQAEAAREKGNDARADILEDRADTKAMAPAEPKVEEPPKVAGVSTRKVWKFEITDPKLVPEQYKTIDEKKIGGVVRALKGDTEIPGVRVYSEDTLSARAS